MNKPSSSHDSNIRYSSSITPAEPGKVNLRYDEGAKMWAIIDSSGNTIEHVDRGVMTDVQFYTYVTEYIRGCLSHRGYIGIASGVLKKGAVTKATGLKNLDFKGEEGFVCPDGVPLNKAKILVLSPDRRAVYK